MTNILSTLNPSDAQRMLDHAATQSDRWLFLAAFVALVAVMGAANLWLAKWLRKLVDEQRATNLELAGVVRDNTAVLVVVKERLGR